ncbi:MAG TPA: DUF1800 domain-containing protein [Vicinamibacterales bacterium]|nr:DUF1800 domain-containing protein [Vicinamibacterales bacterium]
MARPSPAVEHLLRRAGFGATPEERDKFSRYTVPNAIVALTSFNLTNIDVDKSIGTPGYVGVTVRNPGFAPNTNITDARQRWLFRMVHSPSPLQEKMTLFWHHHFATAFSKISGIYPAADATRMMAAKKVEDSTGMTGQIELFRQNALGNFRELLVAVAQDPAMLVWLDGRLNQKNNPQENFGRELMELFTFGVENYRESDVYAAARVFTGWNMRITGTQGSPSATYSFAYNANNHDTNAKDFSFPVYGDGSTRIPARSSLTGMADGMDLIAALASHPETARRLARRLWTWFISEAEPPESAFVENIAQVYLQNDTNMKPVVRAVLQTPQFIDKKRFYQRYAWPVEFVVRSLKEVGHVGFSVDSAITPLLNMGQQLFEPPDVNGWELGAGWFSTGGMLARMNFASALALNQRFAVRDQARDAWVGNSADNLLAFVLERLSLPAPDAPVRAALINYINAGAPFTGSESQLLNKTGGLFHLLTGSGEYQLV